MASDFWCNFYYVRNKMTLFLFQLGFGKCTPTTCVWLNNIPETITQKFLAQNFGRYGLVMHSVLDRIKQRALIYFDGIDFAQTAVNEMRGRTLNGNKIQVRLAACLMAVNMNTTMQSL